MKQLSPQEASALKRTRFWERLTTRQIAEFQLGQDQLCIPLETYQNALSVELDRVYLPMNYAIRSNYWTSCIIGPKRPHWKKSSRI